MGSKIAVCRLVGLFRLLQALRRDGERKVFAELLEKGEEDWGGGEKEPYRVPPPMHTPVILSLRSRRGVALA